MSALDIIHPDNTDGGDDHSQRLFAKIAEDISELGYSICPQALPDVVALPLAEQAWNLSAEQFKTAGIGRHQQHQFNPFVRRDKVCWITGESDAGKTWLDWTSNLKAYLNRRLIMGLASFESHYAWYPEGAFYKRHYDAFSGVSSPDGSNRVLSLVAYLNSRWAPEFGGELVLYHSATDTQGTVVVPNFATLVVFLSEQFPHEVLATNQSRLSIAGWFRSKARLPIADD